MSEEKKNEYRFKTNISDEFFVRNERKTPMKNVIRNIENLSEEQSKSSLVVLLSTGSFNPIHTGHVKMMALAKQHLETLGGYVVVGGFLSTSHLDYLHRKLGNHALSNEDRCKLIELCIEGNDCSDWLHADAAECEHKSFSSIPQVVRTLEEYIEKVIEKHKIRVIYVCGKDLFIGCYGFQEFQSEKNGVIMIDRPTQEEWYRFVENQIIEKSDKKNCFIVKNNEETMNVSSTKIRSLMVQGNEEEILKQKMIPSACVEYMKKKKLFNEPEEY